MSAPVDDPLNQKRSRIVVNLDPTHGAAMPDAPQAQQPYAAPLSPVRKRKKWPIVLGIIGFVLIALAVTAIIYWQNFKTKPAYSLALAVSAAQRNDATGFDEVFDTERVVSNFTPQVIDVVLGRFGASLTPGIRSTIEGLVPTLIVHFKDQVRDEVMRKVRDATKQAEGRSFILMALGIHYLLDIKQEGDTALITAKSEERNTELTMERRDSRWKVVAVKDEDLAKRLADKIMKDLPVIGGGLIDDAAEQIKKRLPDILPKSSGVTGKGKRR
ncbi:MAG TPA: hypothetical protein VF791_13430 [Pyrinomonadaceae bacterium]